MGAVTLFLLFFFAIITVIHVTRRVYEQKSLQETESAGTFSDSTVLDWTNLGQWLPLAMRSIGEDGDQHTTMVQENEKVRPHVVQTVPLTVQFKEEGENMRAVTQENEQVLVQRMKPSTQPSLQEVHATSFKEKPEIPFSACIQDCKRIYSPVCVRHGSLLITYDNKCTFEIQQCLEPFESLQLLCEFQCPCPPADSLGGGSEASNHSASDSPLNSAATSDHSSSTSSTPKSSTYSAAPSECPAECPTLFQPVCALNVLTGKNKSFSNPCVFAKHKCDFPQQQYEVICPKHSCGICSEIRGNIIPDVKN